MPAPETSHSRFSSKEREKKVWIIRFGSAQEERICYDVIWIYGVLEVALKNLENKRT